MRERWRVGAIARINIGIPGLLWSRRTKQLARPRDVVGAGAIGEQAVVTDAMESTGQHMDEEAADELVGRERHGLLSFTPLGAIVLPLEGHAGIVERDQAAVGDGDTMGVAREIRQYGLRSAEWTLAVDDPFPSA